MSNHNHSAATKDLLGTSPSLSLSLSLFLDIDLSKDDLGVPITTLDIDLTALEADAKASGWLPGDDMYRQVYELVKAGGTVWREACKRVGVDYATAQHRYRLRGLPSPVRTFPIPSFGSREETAAVVYSLVLHGQPVSTAARSHGISRQYFWGWCKRSRLPNPSSALRNAKTSIANFTAKA